MSKVSINIPSIKTTNALAHHVRKALRQYAAVHQGDLTPEFCIALVDESVVVPEEFKMPPGVVFVADGNRPEDASGARGVSEAVKQFVITAVNHETMHTRMEIKEVEDRVEELENTQPSAFSAQRLAAVEDKVRKLESRYQDLLRVLCETPETKKVLSRLLGIDPTPPVTPMQEGKSGKERKYEVQVGCTMVFDVEAENASQAGEKAIKEADESKHTFGVEAIREGK